MDADAGTLATAAPRRLLVTSTERQVAAGLALTITIGLLFAAAGAIERRANPEALRAERLVWNGWETSTRLLAVGHTVVATLFLLTARRVRAPGPVAGLAGLAVLGGLLAWGFSALGGMGAPVAAALFYAYFLLHEVRDEAYFYRANGDAPAGAGAPAGPVAGLLLLALLATFGAGASLGVGRGHEFVSVLRGASPAARVAVAAAIVAACAALARWPLRALRRADPAGLQGALRRHRPLVVVYALLYAALLLGMALTGRMYAIVALHVCGWYVFVARRMARAEREGRGPAPRPRAGTWRWMRTTAAGFHALHVGVFALLVGLAAVWAYGSANSPDVPILPAIVSRDAFPLWTVFHVTLSWFPRGG